MRKMSARWRGVLLQLCTAIDRGELERRRQQVGGEGRGRGGGRVRVGEVRGGSGGRRGGRRRRWGVVALQRAAARAKGRGGERASGERALRESFRGENSSL